MVIYGGKFLLLCGQGVLVVDFFILMNLITPCGHQCWGHSHYGPMCYSTWLHVVFSFTCNACQQLLWNLCILLSL